MIWAANLRNSGMTYGRHTWFSSSSYQLECLCSPSTTHVSVLGGYFPESRLIIHLLPGPSSWTVKLNLCSSILLCSMVLN
jgi:hypothetical protein